MKTLRDIACPHAPILVIGGGPSVPQDLARLKRTGCVPALVLSANEHGCLQEYYAVTHIVCFSARHGLRQEAMRDVLSSFALPCIGPFPWCDVQVSEHFGTAGNTGLATLALAVALEGAPVLVTGIDGFAPGRRYFHGTQRVTERTPPLDSLEATDFAQRTRQLARLCEGGDVSPLSGPLRRLFPPTERRVPCP